MQKQQIINSIKITFLTKDIITYIVNNKTVVSVKPNYISNDVLNFLESNNLKDYYSIVNRIDDYYLKLNE